MDVFALIVAGSYSIGLAAFIAAIRLRKIHKSYRPFLYFLFAALINEICSNLMIHFGRSNAPGNNIFGLVEWGLWVWQFKEWKALDAGKWQHMAAIILLPGIWITENIILGKLNSFSSIYGIVYSVIVILMSINVINRRIVEESKHLLMNAEFIICSGLVIFSTYRILVECFYLLELEASNAFLGNIFLILVIVNLFVNILFAIATIWIPTRQRFTLRYL